MPTQIQLVQAAGATRVSDAMVRVSPYQLTIDLGEAGLRPTPLLQRIVVSTSTAPAVELSEVNVIQLARVTERR